MLLNCCVREDLRVPWTARRSNQSNLKEIRPGCSLEGLILKLKLQDFGHLMQRTDSFERPWCWERLKLGGEGDDRGWDGLMDHQLNGHGFEWTLGVGDGQGGLACCSPCSRKELDTTEWLNWTELNFPFQRRFEDQNFNVLWCVYVANNAVATLDLWVLTQSHIIILATDYVNSQNCS